MDLRRWIDRLWLFFLATFLGCLAAIAGCSGQKGGKPLFKVHGRLTYRGQPMAKAMISFYPVDPKDRSVSSQAVADEDGRYGLQTYRKDDGAPAGDYVVTIYWPGPPLKTAKPGAADSDAPAPDRLQNAYSWAGTSKLRATVREQDNAIDFELP